MRLNCVFALQIPKAFNVLLLLACLYVGNGIAANSKSASGKNAAVATVHPLASAAALQAIRDRKSVV